MHASNVFLLVLSLRIMVLFLRRLCYGCGSSSDSPGHWTDALSGSRAVLKTGTAAARPQEQLLSSPRRHTPGWDSRVGIGIISALERQELLRSWLLVCGVLRISAWYNMGGRGGVLGDVWCRRQCSEWRHWEAGSNKRVWKLG